jgi:hypothetical protein
MTAVKQPLCLSLSFVGYMQYLCILTGGALNLWIEGLKTKLGVDEEAKVENAVLRDC